MLAIRLQRTGRKGYAQYRIVVQDAQRTPTSGRIVANIGNFNPHTKVTVLDKEKASYYIDNGAQPSGRVVSLLESEGVKLPTWVSVSKNQKRSVKSPEKLRKNQPKEAVPKEAAASTEQQPTEPTEES